MEGSVILNSPILLVGYGIALFLCVFDLCKHSSGYAFSIIEGILCSLTSGYALILGANYGEVTTAVLIFLALNLSVYGKHNGEKK